MSRTFFSFVIIFTLLAGITFSIVEQCGGLHTEPVLNQCPVDTVGAIGMSVAQALDTVIVTAFFVVLASAVFIAVSVVTQSAVLMSRLRFRHAQLRLALFWQCSYGNGHYSSSYL